MLNEARVVETVNLRLKPVNFVVNVQRDNKRYFENISLF